MTSEQADALFERAGEQRFMPTERSRGPWALEVLHGGPVAGLLAHAIEQRRSDDGLRLVRLTVDLFRPVPYASLEVTARDARSGRRIQVVDAVVTADGREVSRASGLLLRGTDEETSDVPDTDPGPLPSPDEVGPGRGGGQPGPVRYTNFVEFRPVPAEASGGTRAQWVRIPCPLLPGEAMSPAVRAAATADFANPFAHAGPSGLGFINADITMYLHRPPEGEWLCVQVTHRADAGGIAVGDAALRDLRGPVGRSVVASMVSAAPAGGAGGAARM